MPDDDDEVDEAGEYEAWKLRELRRIKRDREVREAIRKDREETERRRSMTDAERALDDKRLEAEGLKVFTKEKTEMKFMQRYHHKGAFYVDEDSMKDTDKEAEKAKVGVKSWYATEGKQDVRRRKTNGATGRDQFNMEALPKIMQVGTGASTQVLICSVATHMYTDIWTSWR